MPSPAYLIMDKLSRYGDSLREVGEYEKALDVDILVETANRAGHQYPWDHEACVREVLAAGKAIDWMSSRHLGELEELIG